MSEIGETEKTILKYLSEGEGFVDLIVYVKPNSPQTQLTVEAGDLVFYTREPAEKGRANASLIHYLSKILGIPISKIEIIRGARDRLKRIRIRDATIEEVLEKIAQAIKQTQQ